MATNPYFQSNFNAVNAEQDLVNDLIIESHKIYGWDMLYLPRTLVNYDTFFGEDTKSAFNDAYQLEFYVKSYQGFEGNQYLSQIGYAITEKLTLTCSRTRFTEEITIHHPTIKRPLEGDLIYIPNEIDERQRVYEISYVNQTEVFSQLGSRYTWEIQCQVFDFNGESFDTGNPVIDGFEVNYLSTEIQLTVGSGLFVIGDSVTQTNGFSGVVLTHEGVVLTVTNTKGIIDSTLPITNGTITRNIADITSEVKNDSAMNDNDYIKTKKENGLINFSEDNPFSGF